MTEFVVDGIDFVDGGIQVTFMRVPDDVRNDGRLIASRRFAISEDHHAYGEEIAEIKELVTSLVADVFEDFDSAPIAIPDTGEEAGDEDDDDDDKGMGE